MTIPENAENFNKDGAGRDALIVSFIRYEKPVGKCFAYQNGELTKAFSHRSGRAVGETSSFQSFEEFMDWQEYTGGLLDPDDVAPLTLEENARYLESVEAANRRTSWAWSVSDENLSTKDFLSERRARNW